ncbi:MAG: tannase/feruloyl esterase family alpha/beta hydrolase [Rhodospirillaceae bacterium]
MESRLIAPLGVAFSFFVFVSSSNADTGSAQERCLAMSKPGAEAEYRMVSIPDAPTRILNSQLDTAADGLPESCRVDGLIAPNTHFELRMPTETWNGKFLMFGCGGYCGFIDSLRSDPGLAQNYAVVLTDMGHQGRSWLFAYNNLQGEIDFGFRSTHTVAVASKEIIDHYYGNRAEKNYFMGCSTGGRQAMVEAQRFPRDFDGIIAGAPVYDETGDGAHFVLWSPLANMDEDGNAIMNPSKLPMIRRAVMDQCDAADGLEDNILQDPQVCNWEPEKIQCRTPFGGDDCLTRDEVNVVKKIYSGATNSEGEPWYFGMSVGSEYTWTPEFIQEDKVGDWLEGPQSFGEEFITTMPFFYDPPVGTPANTYDFDKDPPRMGLTEWLYNAQNPDLRKFKKNGGKLILYHGWDDDQIPPGISIDYYQTATRTMGGQENTKDFFRLFMMPSMLHCIMGGPGGTEVDWVGVLEDWVENGEAPDKVLVHRMKQTGYGLPRPRHPLGVSDFDQVRPVYAYPGVARYKGSGDTNDPDNWAKR